MPRSFSFEVHYPNSPADVHRAITDERMWRSRFKGAETATLDVATPDGPGTIELTMSERVDKDRTPMVVRKVLKDEMSLTRTDRWGALEGDTATGVLHAHSTGIPGKVEGRYTLRRSGDGAVLQVSGEIEVKIRFVGGAIEPLGVQLLTRLANGERDYTTKWLSS
ncbi:DUF2505 domain-containing protein [Skermania sp. ID1734]|uniref:DUF2505 domain-containing protein n=1 Tax=Skermania sp. ID1734 TaxID=2597516 RepID=UPI00163DA061|nr:DUF2505 domain-containing protein [Skermania sp. ID1734]